MSKCQPGSYIGANEATSQFSCPEKSKYYRELEVYDVASNIENKIANQDARVENVSEQVNNFQTQAKNLLGTKENTNQTLQQLQDDIRTDKQIADAQKWAVTTEDTFNRVIAAQKEKQALQEAIKQNRRVAEMIYYDNEKRKNTAIRNKSRIIDINLDAYRDKKTLIKNLSYVIYFLLYSIALGIAVGTGVVSARFVGIALLLGLVILSVFAIMSSGFLKTYGDVSMKIAKGATKEFIKAVAPIKSCPPRCKTNSTFNKKIEKEDQRQRNCDPSKDPDCSYSDKQVMPYDYKIDNPDKASRFFSEGEFGTEDVGVGKPFTCVWSGDQALRPSYEPYRIRSSIPCNYYENRMSV